MGNKKAIWRGGIYLAGMTLLALGITLTTLAGLPTPAGRCGPKELIQNFCWDKIAKNDIATEL